MSELETKLEECKKVVKQVFNKDLGELYNYNKEVANGFYSKFEVIAKAHNCETVDDVEELIKKIKEVGEQIKEELNKIPEDEKKEPLKRNESFKTSRNVIQNFFNKQTSLKNESGNNDALKSKNGTVKKNNVEDKKDESDKPLDIKEIIKDGAEVKKYIKSKFNSFNDINNFIGKMAENYKSKDECMPIKDLRRIYGTKGCLMMIYRLENEGSGKKKSGSVYRKYCERILKDYRDLKVEAAVATIASGTIDVSKVSEKASAKDIEKFKRLVDEIVSLKNKGKLEMTDDRRSNRAIYSSTWGGLIGLIVCCLGVGGTMAALLLNPLVIAGVFSATILTLPVAVLAGSTGGSAYFDKFSMEKTMKALKEQLKNFKGNGETKRLVNKVLKMAEEVSENNVNATSIKVREDYIKKYNSFVNKSGKLAVKYLSWVGKSKIKRLKRAENNKDAKGKDLVIDAYKVIFMCLIAACSKNKKQIRAGTDFFSNNKTILSKFVG